MEAAQYESLGRADDALLVKMLQAGLQKLKAGNHGGVHHPRCFLQSAFHSSTGGRMLSSLTPVRAL